MTRRNVKLGQKFPEEETLQSSHSPGVVQDEEFVERELRTEGEVHRGVEPTEAAFPRKQLLGRSGSGLSVTRRKSPSPGLDTGVASLRRVLHRVYAQAGELRRISENGEARAPPSSTSGTSSSTSRGAAGRPRTTTGTSEARALFVRRLVDLERRAGVFEAMMRRMGEELREALPDFGEHPRFRGGRLRGTTPRTCIGEAGLQPRRRAVEWIARTTGKRRERGGTWANG